MSSPADVMLASVSTPATAVPIPVTTTSRLIYSRPTVVMGWAFVETTGTANATVYLRNGRDAGGTLVVPISLLSAQSTRDYLSPAGVYCDSGIYLQVISGSVTGSVWVLPI